MDAKERKPLAASAEPNARESSPSRSARSTNSEFLSGGGTAKLNRMLVGQNEEHIKSNSSNLISRLQQFLPELARANESLPPSGALIDSAVEIVVSDDSNKEASDDQEESSDEDVEEDSGASPKPTIEMNISLFPLDESSENENVSVTTEEVRAKGGQPTKKRLVVEEIGGDSGN